MQDSDVVCGYFPAALLDALRQVRLANPIELLHSEQVSEKPPRANWILAIAGAVILAGAYYIAVSIEDPITAMVWFFVAVVMMIATYLLFIAGSVTLCRILQRKKKYYYKTQHFISVSSMMYRMKRNRARDLRQSASSEQWCLLCFPLRSVCMWERRTLSGDSIREISILQWQLIVGQDWRVGSVKT